MAVASLHTNPVPVSVAAANHLLAALNPKYLNILPRLVAIKAMAKLGFKINADSPPDVYTDKSIRQSVFKWLAAASTNTVDLLKIYFSEIFAECHKELTSAGEIDGAVFKLATVSGERDVAKDISLAHIDKTPSGSEDIIGTGQARILTGVERTRATSILKTKLGNYQSTKWRYSWLVVTGFEFTIVFRCGDFFHTFLDNIEATLQRLAQKERDRQAKRMGTIAAKKNAVLPDKSPAVNKRRRRGD
jgi:hypothetical protein